MVQAELMKPPSFGALTSSPANFVSLMLHVGNIRS